MSFKAFFRDLEGNSIFSIKSKRSQSALEYMMTYGWAILIIVIVAVILYSMGIFNPSSSISSTITGFQQTPISSAICTPTGVLVVSIEDATGNLINITSVNATANGKTAITSPNQLINPGNSARVLILGGCSNVSNTHFSSQITINYKEPGQPLSGPYVSTGSIFGTSSSFSQNTVANMTNQSTLTVPGTNSTSKIWNGGYSYTLTMWVKMDHAYGTCSGYPCEDLFQTNQGCTSGLEQDPDNSTGYQINLLEWNSDCGSGTAAQGSPYQYVPYGKWELITGVFKYNSQGNAWVASCVDTYCTNSSWSLSAPAVYSTPETILGAGQLNGKIADIQMYDIALSNNQIKTLYGEGYAGIPVTTNGLIAWFPLDGNANDYSGNNNNGVPTAVNWISP